MQQPTLPQGPQQHKEAKGHISTGKNRYLDLVHGHTNQMGKSEEEGKQIRSLWIAQLYSSIHLFILILQGDLLYSQQQHILIAPHTHLYTHMPRPSTLFILTLCLLLPLSYSLVTFQPTQSFAALQTRLTTTSGLIPATTGTTFSLANPGYSSFSSLGVALCGYDLPAQLVVQFGMQISYDSTTNAFVFLLQPQNNTVFFSLNYYLLIATSVASTYLHIQDQCFIPNFALDNPTVYNRTYTNYRINGPFVFQSSTAGVVLPFLRSIKTVSFGTYNYYNLTKATYSPGSKTVSLVVFLNYSMTAEVCYTFLFYHKTVAQNNQLYYNASATMNLPLSSNNSNATLAVNALNAFFMDGIYGPNYSPKCVVGLHTLTWDVSNRQTLGFNLTGTTVFNLMSSAFYKAEYGFFCLAEIVCSSSSQQYYPLINACEPICTLSNCSLCSTSTSCKTCSGGYFLTTLLRCQACLPDCEVCTNELSCSTCINGTYYNSSGRSCLPCNQHCLRCSASSCMSCEAGYIASGVQCVKCSVIMSQCLQCTSSAYCNLCPSHTFYQNSMTGCVNCSIQYVGCLTCINQLRCTSCIQGYYLRSSICAVCVVSEASCCSFFVANCVNCSSVSQCRVCMVGYYLASNFNCVPCDGIISNCSTCISSLECSQCATGFFLSAYSNSTNNSTMNGTNSTNSTAAPNITNNITATINTCQLCLTALSNCLTCSNSTFCLTCSPPFLPVLGICTNCPIWPLNQLYYLDAASVCQPCTSVAPFCTRCLSSVQCTQCQQLYYLLGGTCLLCESAIPNCLGCKNSSSCLVCRQGYYPTMTNTSQCLVCNTAIPSCLACIQTYLPSSGTYQLDCLNCQPEYFVNGSICSPCNASLQFCLTCSTSYQCLTCQQGFYLSSTLLCIDCAAIIQGCTLCTSASTCISCLNGYYLAGSYCSLCRLALPNCLSCVPAPASALLLCSSCVAGYYLDSNTLACITCNSTIQFCTACSNSTFCTGCLSGYLARNGICVTCSTLLPNCLYCPSFTCRQCLPNYILDPLTKQCLPCSYFIPGCSTCLNNTDLTTNTSQLTCVTCSTGYIIFLAITTNRSSCLSCNSSMLYCSSCTNLTTCLSCQSSTFLSTAKTCSLCTLYLPHCLSCTNYTECLGCASGYYLASNGSCVVCNTSSFGQVGTRDICLQCVYVNNVPNCTFCMEGYYLNQGNCSSCSGAIAECRTCTGSSLCLACNDYFYLSAFNTQCLPCLSSLTYCISCNNLGTCLSCRSDAYLNTTINTCVLCTTVINNCSQCSPNVTSSTNLSQTVCILCQDGFYLLGNQCISCQSAMPDCVLCSNATNCQVKNSNTQKQASGIDSLPFWVYLVIAIVGLLTLLICIICFCCCCKNKQKKSQPNTPEQSQTQRQLVSQQVMERESPLILAKEKCYFCMKYEPNVMYFQLLCGQCQEKQHRGHKHKIKQDMDRKHMQEIGSEEAMQPPPSSVIKQNEDGGDGKGEGEKKDEPRTWSEYRQKNDKRRGSSRYMKSVQPK